MTSKEGFLSAKHILQQKVNEQCYIANIKIYPCVTSVETKENLLLFEARIAKKYWSVYKKKLPSWVIFPGRKSHNKDLTNTLLDIGYHTLTNKLEKLIQKHNISSSLAVLHVPHNEKSKPLVYDLMELFRTHVVDEEVLIYLHRKKKPITQPLSSYEIRKFIIQLQKKCEHKLYIKEFKQCHTYNYYIELQLLRYIHAVNHKKIFIPMRTPKRHESRCS